MVYPKERSSGFAMPVIAILFAMAGLIAAIVISEDRNNRRGAKVWVPLQRDVNVSDDGYGAQTSNVARTGSIRVGP